MEICISYHLILRIDAIFWNSYFSWCYMDLLYLVNNRISLTFQNAPSASNTSSAMSYIYNLSYIIMFKSQLSHWNALHYHCYQLFCFWRKKTQLEKVVQTKNPGDLTIAWKNETYVFIAVVWIKKFVNNVLSNSSCYLIILQM